MKKRQIISLALAGAMSLGLLAGCGSADDTTTASGTTETQKENAASEDASASTNEDAVATLIANTTGTVDLTVWASEEDQEFTTGLLNSFKEKYKDVDFNITLGAESESKGKDAWGENYAATKLPTFTVAGEQKQMSSFSGYKLIGVNPHSKNVGWAMILAEYLTNYDSQVARYEARGLGPSNIEASNSDVVQADPAIAALAAQAEYATPQRVGNNYWDLAKTLGQMQQSLFHSF